MLFKYSANNSGGSWWLSDDNWKALEEAGWTVDWYETSFLGALATSAEKEFETLKEAVEEFESTAGQDLADEGCNCCGPPHSMMWTDADGKYNYVSAEDFVSRDRVNPWD